MTKICSMVELSTLQQGKEELSEILPTVRKFTGGTDYAEKVASTRRFGDILKDLIRGGYIVVLSIESTVYDSVFERRAPNFRPELYTETDGDTISIPISGVTSRCNTVARPGNHLMLNSEEGQFSLAEYDGANLVGFGSLTFPVSAILDILVEEE